MIHRFLLSIALLGAMQASAGELGVRLRPIDIPDMPGLQSFAIGAHGNKVVLIGGRTDGLHRRQPPMSFPPEGEPQRITVVDLEQRRVWTAGVSTLPPDVLDQWTSTNVCFTQIDTTLILIGGYGIASVGGGHRTHPVWSTVSVPALIDAIVEQRPFASLVTFGTGDPFAITGGRAGFFGDTIITVGGHRFEGRYNPMDGPSFTQTYTNAIRRFSTQRTPTGLALTYVRESVDALLLHRRDYNMVPQVLPDGTHGYTAFSGVFRIGADLPFLEAVDVRPDTHVVVPNFEQMLNHYHCGTLPVFDPRDGSMHTFFFGGMAQFRPTASGGLERNDSVPFVNTIARVTRTVDGVMREYRMPKVMPALLGSGAEVVHRHALDTTRHGVVRLGSGEVRDLVAGWIIGGIRSDAPNIFWVNDGTQSEASAFVAEIVLDDKATSVYVAPSDSQRGHGPEVNVVSTSSMTTIRAKNVSTQATIEIYDLNGRYVDVDGGSMHDGTDLVWKFRSRALGRGVYVVVVMDGDRSTTTLLHQD